MKTLEFIYHETEIHFLINSSEDVTVNATEMAIIFNKDPEEFLSDGHAQEFIKALEAKLGAASFRREIGKDIVEVWMNRKLAIKFASWLDPEFELWIYDTIETLRFSHYDNHLRALNAQQAEKLRFNNLCRKAVSEQNELAIQIIESHRKLKKFTNDKRNAIVHQEREIKNLFDMFDEN
ncbi:KilA-N domain-containing protein [uncultured Flavobacterium sp.]|uniref:KilA-N domain-containing protein n=1 Tax=uncultured Flavobacterium sp. TaxID=165435 RepID=UPI0025FE82B8|nr:KilA-N domain-containing protein [uncultured Flavobacterium sp.]